MGRWHDLKSALNNMTAVHWLVATKVNIVEKKLPHKIALLPVLPSAEAN